MAQKANENGKATAKTQAAYRDRGEWLLSRYERESDMEWRDNPDAFKEWASALAGKTSPSTWRLYRRGLVAILGDVAPIDLLQHLDALTGGRVATSEREGTAHRLRKLPDDDLRELLLFLEKQELRLERKNSDPIRSIIICWLIAGRAFGLRPSEWWGAKIDGDWMMVKNKKYRASDGANESGRRAFGPFRHVFIADMSQEELDAANLMIDAVAGTFEYESIRQRCSRYLQDAHKKLWPRRKQFYSLYSARHQFIADAKASGLSPLEIAALSGHLSIETARTHYGHRNSGRRYRAPDGPVEIALNTGVDAPLSHSIAGFRVLPSQDDIRAVAAHAPNLRRYSEMGWDLPEHLHPKPFG
ncbi:hypothetical protein ACNSTU_13555 [Aquisalimonas sp. APHAB1-3]|uniref:hypothetical protein n=1 Tax=Aquisalimonas sp. APHAB1-3 TaxID=3402080 RepID=UPI003AB0B3EB